MIFYACRFHCDSSFSLRLLAFGDPILPFFVAGTAFRAVFVAGPAFRDSVLAFFVAGAAFSDSALVRKLGLVGVDLLDDGVREC